MEAPSPTHQHDTPQLTIQRQQLEPGTTNIVTVTYRGIDAVSLLRADEIIDTNTGNRSSGHASDHHAGVDASSVRCWHGERSERDSSRRRQQRRATGSASKARSQSNGKPLCQQHSRGSPRVVASVTTLSHLPSNSLLFIRAPPFPRLDEISTRRGRQRATDARGWGG